MEDMFSIIRPEAPTNFEEMGERLVELEALHAVPPAWLTRSQQWAADLALELAGMRAQVLAVQQQNDALQARGDATLDASRTWRQVMEHRVNHVETRLGVLSDHVTALRRVTTDLVDTVAMLGESADNFEEWRMRLLIATGEFAALVKMIPEPRDEPEERTSGT